MQNVISHGLVIFMALIEDNDSFLSIIFDSSGALGEWKFPHENLKNTTSVIANDLVMLFIILFHTIAVHLQQCVGLILQKGF